MNRAVHSSIPPFRGRLRAGVIICDGAMGTMLYAKGIFINRCFDELNLGQPHLVQEVHREYARAGPAIIEPYTFAANRVKLRPLVLEWKLRAIHLRGTQIAREARPRGGSIPAMKG